MTTKHRICIALLVPLACTKPEDDVHPPSDEGPLADDEVSELPPVDPEGPAEPLPSGYCLYASDPPREGIWHQCGGSIDIDITGDALGSPIDEDIFIDFGSHVDGDSYQHPRVAACCGEYDHEQLASEQSVYWDNCLYDAIQQFCVALPYYIWDMADAAHENNDLVIEDQLNKIGNDLATGDKQYECLDTLWSGGPTDPFNVISDRAWNPAYDVWVNIDILEVYDLFLPEDPSDWLTCRSIFDNDDTVVPDMGSNGPVLDTLTLDSGWMQLSGIGVDETLSFEPSSELIIGRDSQTAVLGTLQLRGGATRVAGVTVERWRIATLRAVALHELDDGSFIVPPGGVTFVGSAVHAGETLSTASIGTSLVLRPNGAGWTLDPFSLGYTSSAGHAWTLDISELRFGPR